MFSRSYYACLYKNRRKTSKNKTYLINITEYSGPEYKSTNDLIFQIRKILDSGRSECSNISRV